MSFFPSIISLFPLDDGENVKGVFKKMFSPLPVCLRFFPCWKNGKNNFPTLSGNQNAQPQTHLREERMPLEYGTQGVCTPMLNFPI